MTRQEGYWHKKLMKDFGEVTPSPNLELLATIADNTEKIIELLQEKKK